MSDQKACLRASTRAETPTAPGRSISQAAVSGRGGVTSARSSTTCPPASGDPEEAAALEDFMDEMREAGADG